ncbi:guanine nucleotide exchange factor [Obelidium mucronatum]|nr:guanine nucleotide exchange factor [Obelidium mucronatum]
MALVTPLGLPSLQLIKQPSLIQVIKSTLSGFTEKNASAQAFVAPDGLFEQSHKQESVHALVTAFTITCDDEQNDRDLNLTEDDKSALGASKNWPDEVAVLGFQALKILGREVSGSDSLMSKNGIKMLMTHAGLFSDSKSNSRSNGVTLEAMKCLVNCIHVRLECRESFVEMDGINLTIQHLQNKNLSSDAKFLALRFLFLLSGHSPVYAAEMSKIQDLGSLLNQIVLPYVNHLIEGKPISKGLGNELNIPDEVLKIVFNVTMVRESESAGLGGLLGGGIPKTAEEKAAKRDAANEKKIESVKGFEMFLPILVDLITCIPVKESDPLSAPHSFAINCLLNFPASPEFFLQWLPGPNKDKIPEQLCKILAFSLKLAMPYNSENAIPLEPLDHPPPPKSNTPDYSKKKADEIIPPVVLVLKELANCHPKLREILRGFLTPEDIDRTRKLDSTDTTVARLIRLMTSISLENVKNSVGELLYALFDEDASKLTSYIGYGNAAGFLFQRGIMSDPNSGGGGASSSERPSSALSDDTVNDADSYEIYDGPKEQAPAASSSKKGKGKAQPKLNPITGEIMKDEKQTNEEWDRLSDAEKEYETYKLMEMLDKLNKSGFIKAVHKNDMDGANK